MLDLDRYNCTILFIDLLDPDWGSRGGVSGFPGTSGLAFESVDGSGLGMRSFDVGMFAVSWSEQLSFVLDSPFLVMALEICISS